MTDQTRKKKKQPPNQTTVNHHLMPGINALNPPPPLPVVPSWEGAPRPREDPGAVGPGPVREELQGSGPVLPGKPTWGAETICSLLEQADVAG